MSVIASGPTKNDLITALVQKELKFSAILAGLVTDVSAFAVKGNQSISFPKLSSFTVGNRALGTAGSESVITATKEKMDLDQSAYLAWIIDPKDAIQSTIEWEMETVKRASSAHGRYVDEKLINVLETYGTPVGVAGNITKAIVLEMRKILKTNQADLNQCVLLVSAEQEANLLNIDEFTHADVYGAGAPLATGVVGRIYGVPCIVHSGLPAGSFYMFEKTGIAIGFQANPAYDEGPALEYGAGAKKRVLDQLFGVMALQVESGVSKLIVKHGV